MWEVALPDFVPEKHVYVRCGDDRHAFSNNAYEHFSRVLEEHIDSEQRESISLELRTPPIEPVIWVRSYLLLFAVFWRNRIKKLFRFCTVYDTKIETSSIR